MNKNISAFKVLFFTVLLGVPAFALPADREIKNLLKSMTPENTVATREKIIAYGKAAVKPLISALDDPNVIISAEAAAALGQIGDTAAVMPLIRCLNDKKTAVRFFSAIALAKIGDPIAVEPLIAALWPTLKNPKEFPPRPLPDGIVFALCMFKNNIRDLRDLHQQSTLDKINADQTTLGYDKKKWEKWWLANKDEYMRKWKADKK